jgi:hypothetical protein
MTALTAIAHGLTREIKMATFQVSYSYTEEINDFIEVEAETSEEAEKLAGYDLAFYDGLYIYDVVGVDD